MTESTARAALFELQSSIGPTYTWMIPQKPVCVRIPFPVIDRLEHEAVENFRSLSSRGSEIGGLLFGTTRTGQPSIVTIEDFELISCDYSRGPLYRLSEADMARFDLSILKRGTASPQAVIGMFRSHTRKTLSLDPDDIAFLDSRFRDPNHIVLLVRPYATKASTAGIFIRENGAFQENSLLEFPFRSAMLSSETPVIEPPPAPPAPAPAASSAAAKPAQRGQIVPIASRRDVSSTIEAPVAPKPETVESEPVAASPVAAPSVTQPVPAAKAPASQPSAPKVEDKTAKAKTDERAPAKPKVEDKATAKPKTEERPSKPQVDDRTAKPQVEEKAAKPAVEDKTAKAKVAEPAPKPKVEEKPATVKVASPAAAAAPAPAKGTNRTMLIGGGIGAVLLLIVAFFVFPPLLHRSRPEGTAQDSSQLALRVERTSGEILLTWNRDSEAIKNATHAVLTINDGDQHENVDMDLAQLRNGSISYAPASGDVVFKMEVTGRGNEKVASESVRALRTRPSPLSPADGSPAPASTPAPANTSATNNNTKDAKPNTPDKPNTPNTPNAPNTPAANATPSQPTTANAGTPADPPAQEEPAKPVERTLKPFQAPSLASRLRPANPSDLPDAPTVSGQQPGVQAVTGLNMNSSPVAPPKPAAPAPAPAPATTANNNANDKKGGAQGGQLVQAQLISKKDPEYPKLARETGAKGMVELIATIGTDGKVKSVKVVHGPPMLQKAASDAVLQWKYKPTMLNGVPVEAQTQVFVNFLGGDR